MKHLTSKSTFSNFPLRSTGRSKALRVGKIRGLIITPITTRCWRQLLWSLDPHVVKLFETRLSCNVLLCNLSMIILTQFPGLKHRFHLRGYSLFLNCFRRSILNNSVTASCESSYVSEVDVCTTGPPLFLRISYS